MADTTVPATTASRNIGILLLKPIIQIPPCGAGDATCAFIEIAPAIAPPTMEDGITRAGSAEANGIAPSEMKDAPSSHAALPFSRSGSVKSLGAGWWQAP